MSRKIKAKVARVKMQHKTVVGIHVQPVMTSDGRPMVCQQIKMSDGTAVEIVLDELAAEQLASGIQLAADAVRKAKSPTNGVHAEEPAGP